MASSDQIHVPAVVTRSALGGTRSNDARARSFERAPPRRQPHSLTLFGQQSPKLVHAASHWQGAPDTKPQLVPESQRTWGVHAVGDALLGGSHPARHG